MRSKRQMPSARGGFHFFLRIALLGAVGFSFSHPSPAALDKKAGEVVEIIGQKPKLTYERGQESGSLKVDDALFFKDHVLTDAGTRARLNLKPDPSSEIEFFLHENSDLVIDDTLMKAGGQKDVAARFANGLLKIVTQGLSHKKRLLIHTPNGVVGVRGSKCWIEIEKNIVSIAAEEGQIDFMPNKHSAAYITRGIMERTHNIVDLSGSNNNTTHFYNSQGEKVLQTEGIEILRQKISNSRTDKLFQVAAVGAAAGPPRGFAPLGDAKKTDIGALPVIIPVNGDTASGIGVIDTSLQPKGKLRRYLPPQGLPAVPSSRLIATEDGTLSIGNRFRSFGQIIQQQFIEPIKEICEGFFHPDCK